MSPIKRFELLSLLLAVGSGTMVAQPWVKLTLKDWVNQSPKDGSFVEENGVILGQCVQPVNGLPRFTHVNAMSTKEYGDFVLEFETKYGRGVDSGVGFRCHLPTGPDFTMMRWPPIHAGEEGKEQGPPTAWKVPPGYMFGYQFEMMAASTGYMGNIWDEGRRQKYLDDAMKSRPGASTAFKDDEWNKCRLECRGDHIRTWVNGIACADFHDSMDLRGLLGLQIHGGVMEGVNKETGKPLQVRWRNMRIQESR